MEHTVELSVVTFEALESLVEKGVLNHHELDVGLVAGTTQRCGLLSVKTGGLDEVEAAILLDSLGYVLDSYDFIFLFHFVQSALDGLFINRLGVDFDARTHGARKINALDVGTFSGSGLELDESVDKLADVLLGSLGFKRHLAYRRVNDTVLVNLEVDLTLLNLLDSLGYVDGHSAALGVRHEATRTEYTAEGTDLTHDSGLGDDDINVGPSALDFLNILIEANIVGSGGLGGCLCVRVAEHEHAHLLAGTIGECYHATYHLVSLTGVYAETYIHVERSIKLGEGYLLYKLHSL